MPTDRRPGPALSERMPNDADRTGTPAGVFGAELRFYRPLGTWLTLEEQAAARMARQNISDRTGAPQL